MPKQVKILSVFSLAMMSVAAIVNLRNIPIMASVGFGSVFFYLLAALVFLIPSALICSELASGWPKAGGVYMWVKEAFNPKVGFFAMWSEWFNNVISFPATTSFIAATVAYIFYPNLQQHKIILFSFMLFILWGCTLFNFLGIKASSKLNIIGALCGSIIPGTLIAGLGLFWLFSGKPIQIDFSSKSFFPPAGITNLVFFLGVLSGYAGMQITAFHAPNVKNPKHDYPKAIALSVILIIALTIFASLAIAIVVPKNQIALVTGIMQGFDGFFAALHINWALSILALLIAISGISSLSAWLLGPARGIAVAASQGFFPKWCANESENGAPIKVLILQAVISSFLASLFLFADSLSTALWMLIVLTSQFTLVMNILMFASVIRLRYTHSDTPRPFIIPGGMVGVWLIAGTSILVCFMGIILGYFPPADLHVHNVRQYETFLIVGNLFYIIIPFLIYKIQKLKTIIAN